MQIYFVYMLILPNFTGPLRALCNQRDLLDVETGNQIALKFVIQTLDFFDTTC